jgi:hypothetical protein
MNKPPRTMSRSDKGKKTPPETEKVADLGSENLTAHQGFIDDVDERGVRGWAVSRKAQDNPVRVGLFVHGQLRDSALANLPRKDLGKSVSKDGRAGFSFARASVGLITDVADIKIAVLDENDSPVYAVPKFHSPEKAGVFPKSLSHYPDSVSGIEEKPIFILGAARSGTSALQTAITYSSGHVGFNEGHVLPLMDKLQIAVSDFYRENAQRRREVSLLAAVDEEYWRVALADLVRRMFHHMFGMRPWVDKTPSAAMLRSIPLVSQYWPEARFIFAKRRGLENIQSRRRKFAQFSFEEHCFDWRTSMQAWLDVRDKIKGRAIEVEQFEMIRDRKRVAMRLAEFLQFSPNQAEKLEAALREFRPEQTKALDIVPLSLAGVDWSQDEKEFFVNDCGAIMKQYGYSLDTSYYL